MEINRFFDSFLIRLLNWKFNEKNLIKQLKNYDQILYKKTELKFHINFLYIKCFNKQILLYILRSYPLLFISRLKKIIEKITNSYFHNYSKNFMISKNNISLFLILPSVYFDNIITQQHLVAHGNLILFKGYIIKKSNSLAILKEMFTFDINNNIFKIRISKLHDVFIRFLKSIDKRETTLKYHQYSLPKFYDFVILTMIISKFNNYPNHIKKTSDIIFSIEDSMAFRIGDYITSIGILNIFIKNKFGKIMVFPKCYSTALYSTIESTAQSATLLFKTIYSSMKNLKKKDFILSILTCLSIEFHITKLDATLVIATFTNDILSFEEGKSYLRGRINIIFRNFPLNIIHQIEKTYTSIKQNTIIVNRSFMDFLFNNQNSDNHITNHKYINHESLLQKDIIILKNYFNFNHESKKFINELIEQQFCYISINGFGFIIYINSTFVTFVNKSNTFLADTITGTEQTKGAMAIFNYSIDYFNNMTHLNYSKMLEKLLITQKHKTCNNTQSFDKIEHHNKTYFFNMNSAQNSLNLLNQTFKLSIRKTLKFIISTNAAELSKLYLIKARLKTGNNNKIQKNNCYIFSVKNITQILKISKLICRFQLGNCILVSDVIKSIFIYEKNSN